MSSKFSKKYEGEWKIRTSAIPTEFKIIESPPFSPLPDYNITFSFQARYIPFWYDSSQSNPVFLFQLKLVKLISACISPSLAVGIGVKVKYMDGSVLVDYPYFYPQTVNQMNEVKFDDVVRSRTLTHRENIASNTLIIKCSMTFSDKQQTSPIMTANDIKLNKYAHLIGNLESVYEPSVLSDFTFKVGDRSFPAHKVILAAHSPVFMKMMTQDFLESKTSTVTLNDATPEIFDTFLKYLYSGEIGDMSLDSLNGLYCLADKYDVGFLKSECTTLIISFLSVNSVCDILQLSYSYSDSILKTAAINFVINHIKEIVNRDDWKELVKTQPVIGYEITVNFVPK